MSRRLRFVLGNQTVNNINNFFTGGGIYVNRGNRKFIRGITSSSLLFEDGTCDYTKYSIFTRIDKFTRWINSILGEKIDLTCDYRDNDRYGCWAQNLKIIHEHVKVTETVLGTQKPTKTYFDVTELVIHNQQTIFLPVNIYEIFPNLEKYFVGASQLKSIEKANFQNLKHLTIISLGVNEINNIDADTFWDNKNLITLLLHDNKINRLDRDLFINNLNLKTIYIYGNQIIHLDSDLFRNNLRLEELHINKNKLQFIGATLLKPLKSLMIVNMESNICVNAYFTNATLDDLQKIIDTKCKE